MQTRTMQVPALLTALILASAAGAPAQSPAPEPDSVEQTPAMIARGVFTGDHVIEAGETLREVVVIGGDLRVRGSVEEDAVVLGGDLILEAEGEIAGDAIVTGGRIVNEGGRVRGEMRTIDGRGMNLADQIERAVAGAAAGSAAATAASQQAERAAHEAAPQRSRSWFTPIQRGVAGIFSTMVLALILAGIGSAMVFFGRPYLETVSDTVRGAGLRSAGTGLAASFLAVPAFVVLVVALAVSIVGIPLLLVAIPLYPLLIFAGAVLGLLGVAHALGERAAEQTGDRFDFRRRNSYAYLFTGLAFLLTPLLAGHLLTMTGFLGFFGGLLKFLTWTAIWVAATVGFGAAILSRAGTRRTFVPRPPDAGIHSDDIFVDETIGSHNDI